MHAINEAVEAYHATHTFNACHVFHQKLVAYASACKGWTKLRLHYSIIKHRRA